LRRAADCVFSAGGKLLETKLNSRLDESRRASVCWIITKTFLSHTSSRVIDAQCGEYPDYSEKLRFFFPAT
jgi:hypothetical protein